MRSKGDKEMMADRVEIEIGGREVCLFFFFQAEDGIRDYKVTGVQTCALPIFVGRARRRAVALAGALERHAFHGSTALGVRRARGAEDRAAAVGRAGVHGAAVGEDRKSVV